MFKMFKRPSGNVAIAMLLAVVGVMSGFTLSSLAMRDVVAFQYDFEGFQGIILLRSEAYRGQKIAQKMGTVLIPVRTSERSVEITNSAMRKTFKIQSLLTKGGLSFITDGDVVMGDQAQQTQVKSLVRSKSGIGQTAMLNPKYSMVRKYGIYTLETETFAKFMYFTDTDESPNATNVYFHGPDVLHGRVHSNTNIWIKKTSGGINNGWPTFYGWVSTHGEVISFSGSYSETEVFQGGLSEGYAYTVFPDEASSIRRRNNVVGPQYNNPNVIMYVDVDGAGYAAYMGEVMEPYQQITPVYNPYPPENPATFLYNNQYTVRDTVWSFFHNGTAMNTSKWVNNKLWIKGNFGTYQTWGCGDTLFLLDDITLMNTAVGTDPIGNRTDVVGLVSEKSIVIKYGYRDPIDSTRVHGTSGPDTGNGGIWIYAAMAALGDDGPDNSHGDGVFTFEYQHPHPSVPDVTVNNVTYTRIDLHRYRFPHRPGQLWASTGPGNRNLRIDYPWYNPLWPERTPYLERGYINVYGSISQRRRGFVHRSYYDEEWPSNNNWDQPIDYCGPTSLPQAVQHNDPVFGFTLTNINFPGASGTGTGYKKNYYYDNRFYRISPIDFPEVNRKDETPFAAVNWVIKRPPEYL
ncbi:MAG: hypothetical protein BWX83_00127 [Candidatus Cloacimonetes bacterium ADurb.Bin117]|nr:MAG: hypothetical protein BWX83_00127 [Candidatus Cloacimonetes bacterium ADurb.Bin117]